MIDEMCGYDESTEDEKQVISEFPDEWYPSTPSPHASSYKTLPVAQIKADENFPPEEEKEEASEDIDESKDDIESTDDSHKANIEFADVRIEDYLSDDDDVDLPLKIKMEEISYETCLDIIRYIYTDYCEVLLENAMKLLKAAGLFQIHKLRDICERKISSSINVENVAQILVQAHLTQAENLKEMCISFVVEKFDAVSKTDSFLSMVTSHSDLAVEVLKRR